MTGSGCWSSMHHCCSQSEPLAAWGLVRASWPPLKHVQHELGEYLSRCSTLSAAAAAEAGRLAGGRLDSCCESLHVSSH